MDVVAPSHDLMNVVAPNHDLTNVVEQDGISILWSVTNSVSLESFLKMLLSLMKICNTRLWSLTENGFCSSLWKFYINVSTASYWVRNLSVSWWQYSINCMPEVTDDTDWMVAVNIEGWAWIMHTKVCLWQSKLNQSTYIRRLPCVLCPSYANAIDLVILLNWYNNGWVKYSLLHQATALNSSNSRGCCRAARESDTFIRVSITGTF